MVKLLVPDIIRDNPETWREIITKKGIKIKEDGNYVMFKYDLISVIADDGTETENIGFMDPVVRECRGIVYDIRTLEPVCVPFFKFGNYGEPYCPELDLDSIAVEEKIDGSIMSCWYHDGMWRVSSSGTIDSNKAILDSSKTSMRVLFDECIKNMGTSLNDLPMGYTHMFEMLHPKNRIIVDYGVDGKLVYLGSRDMKTLEETSLEITNIPKPTRIPFTTIDDLVAIVNKYPWDREGHILVDKFYNRVKIKSPEYFRVSSLNNGTSRKKLYDKFSTRVADLVLKMDGEIDFSVQSEVLNDAFYCMFAFAQKVVDEYDKVNAKVNEFKNRGEFIKSLNNFDSSFKYLMLKPKKPTIPEILKYLKIISRDQRELLFERVLNGVDLTNTKES